jgi:hypothetical protein
MSDDIIDGEIIDDDDPQEQSAEVLDDVVDADVVEETADWPLYDAAIAYLEAGWTPTPLRDKVPTQKRWTGIRPSRPDCWAWWVEDRRHNGVGVICGRISGGLVVIDIEAELAADDARMTQVLTTVGAAASSRLLEAMQSSAATTPSGGRHLYFRVTDTETVPGNLKLAFRGSGDDAVLLVETRGEGGQAAAPPAEGRVWLGAAGPGRATEITAEQLSLILDAFKSLDESGIKDAPPPAPAAPYVPDPNRRPSVADAWDEALMTGAIRWDDVADEGWTLVGYDDEGRSLWTRPDYGSKTKAAASAKGFERWIGGPRPVLVVHSTSVPHLPAGKGYRLTPFKVWTHCFFGGDQAAANAALEALATTGEVDPRITRDVPTPVLDAVRRICEERPPLPSPATLAEFVPDLSRAEDELWDARPWLRHIHTFARARMIPPLALLAVALVRATAIVPPWVTLPPLIGGKGSLNLFCTLVGASGAGKTATTSASDELMPWALPWRHVGTGEGLLHMFVKRIREKDPDTGRYTYRPERIEWSVNAVIDEVDTLTAVSSRQGATIMPILRSAWSGATVGFSNADQERSLSLDGNSYRLGLVLGAQPTRLQPLFDDSDGGTPQRFVWAPLLDPGAPAHDSLPDDPGPLLRPALRIPVQQNGVDFTVCDEIRDTVRGNRERVNRTGDTGGLDGHALFTRVKLAAACAVMDGRLDVTAEDWALSGVIQAVSDSTRTWVQQQIARSNAARSHQRAESRATEAVVIDKKVTTERIARVAKVLARAVDRRGELTEGDARRALGRDRADFEAAVHVATAAGWIEEEERPSRHAGKPPVRWFVKGNEAQS